MAGVGIYDAAGLRTVQRKEDALLSRRGTSETHEILDVEDLVFLRIGEFKVRHFLPWRRKDADGDTLRPFDRRFDALRRADKFSLHPRYLPTAHLRRKRHAARLVKAAPVLQIQHLARTVADHDPLYAWELAGRCDLHLKLRCRQKRCKPLRKRFHAQPLLKYDDTTFARIARRERGKTAVAVA